MLKIFVDADACPMKEEIYRVARRYDLPVTLVTNSPLRFPRGSGVSLVVVPGGFDAADDWIVDHLGEDDIIITADIPLASRCLAAGARAIGTTGRPFTRDNIGESLATRNLLSALREAGTLTAGPAPVGRKDRSRFLEALDELIQEIRRRHQSAAVDPTRSGGSSGAPID
jgi:uncharacterized protein